MSKRFKYWGRLVLSACLLLEAMPAMGGLGLRTKFGQVVIENLQPGEVYNTRELANLPLEIVNTQDKRVNIEIEVLKPEPDDIGMVRKEYEPIPDISWIEIPNKVFALDPGQSAITDVLVKIPDDDKYLGKRYQVYIWSHTTGDAFIAVGLKSTLRFTTPRRRLPKEQVKGRKRVELVRNLNFNLFPNIIDLTDFPLGKKIDLYDLDKKILKVLNPNEETYKYALDSIKVRDSKTGLAKGFEDVPDPRWLTFGEEEFELGPDEIKRVRLFLEIPKEDKYKGKDYMIVIEAVVLDQPVVFSVYTTVLVSTKK